jgi:hypothetical protein
MTVSAVAKILDAEYFCGRDIPDFEVASACGADMMSDVMAFVKERVLLMTGLVNPQVIRTAELLDIRAIMFVRGKHPTADMVDMAKDTGIVLLGTKETMFLSCGKLYAAGLRQGGTREIE